MRRAGGLVRVRPILFEGLMLHASAPLSTTLERMPGLAAFVDRWFTRPIAGRTLRTFKQLAEAVRPVVGAMSDATSDATSETSPVTNPSS